MPLTDRASWVTALDGIAHGFTHTWEHAHAASLTTGVDIALWHFDDGTNRLVCPLMERTFDEFRDVATPPGVSGFAGYGDPGRHRSGWAAFVGQAAYVAGYIGLNPFFSPDSWRDRAEIYNSLFALDLSLPREQLLRRMDQNRRRELRAFDERSGHVTMDHERLSRHLRETYRAFAEKSLPAPLRWTGDTLDAYCSAPRVVLIGVDGPDGIEAVHMYGYTEHGADLLLLAAEPLGRKHHAALIWYAVELLQSLGVRLLNLGGGAHHDDSIALAKQRFGADRYLLSAVRETYDPTAYALLCRRRGVDPSASGYFPAYRQAGSTGHS